MTPSEYYQEHCRNGRIIADAEQLKIIKKLEHLYAQLVIEHHKRSSWAHVFRHNRLIKGIYLWGGVGVGKTFLMDCFYHTVPFKQKLRMHFHQFLQKIHHDLTMHQGELDPLQVIAKEIAQQTQVICFDEFFITDITDAMLLGRLLKALFSNKVCLVTTSNTSPDDLYQYGIQRLQFLPAIAMIKENTQVIHLPSKSDYRLRHLCEAGVFYTPLDQAAFDNMEKTFSVLTEGTIVDELPLHIHGRWIPIKKKSSQTIWFEFADICNVPRSQQDYLTIAEQFKTVFISNIPVISSDAKDQICLFINLVDVFYDAKVRLVLSSAESIPELYHRGHHTILEYERTHSRLLEMQSTDYFIRGEE
jgi:cell division protein ZapE